MQALARHQWRVHARRGHKQGRPTIASQGRLADWAVAAAAVQADETAACITLLKKGAAAPGSVEPATLLRAITVLEKAKLKAEPAWEGTLTAPGSRWRLIYTAGSSDVNAAVKGGKGGGGNFFPLTAVQKFEDGIFENGVFLGPVASLTFKGPFAMEGRRLTFDVDTMCVSLLGGRVAIPLKSDSPPIAQRDPKDQKGLPFFLYAYLDEDIIVGRGRSGGLALWQRADPAFCAKAGVLQVYK